MEIKRQITLHLDATEEFEVTDEEGHRCVVARVDRRENEDTVTCYLYRIYASGERVGNPRTRVWSIFRIPLVIRDVLEREG